MEKAKEPNSPETGIPKMKRRRGSFFKVGGLKRQAKFVAAVNRVLSFNKDNSHKYKRNSQVVPTATEKEIPPLEEPPVKPLEPPKLRCEICQMNFKSISKRDLHMDYSAMHQTNLEKALSSSSLAERASQIIAKEVLVQSDELEDSSIPHELLHHGYKYIIRYSIKMEIAIYMQQATAARPYSRAAILCYNRGEEIEYPIVYLDGNKLKTIALATRVRKKKMQYHHLYDDEKAQAPAEVDPKQEKIDEEKWLRENLGTFAASRVGYESPGRITFVKHCKDQYDSILVPGPKELDVLDDERQRRYDIAKEFQETERQLSLEKKELVIHRQRASFFVERTRSSLAVIEKMRISNSTGRRVSRKLSKLFKA